MELRKNNPTLREYLDKYYPGWRGKYPDNSSFNTIYKREVVTEKFLLFFTRNVYKFTEIMYMGRSPNFENDRTRFCIVYNWKLFEEVSSILEDYEYLTGDRFVITQTKDF